MLCNWYLFLWQYLLVTDETLWRISMITFRNLTICHTVVNNTVQSTQVIKSTTYYYYIVYLLPRWDQSSRLYEYNEITKIFSLFFFKNIWLIDIWCLTPLSAIFQLYHGEQIYLAYTIKQNQKKKKWNFQITVILKT